jgi:hypothetical protein
MKSRITLSLLLSLLYISIFAQAPQGIHYQAVVRNGNGDPLLNTNVQFRFTIEGPGGFPIYYQETQSATSNAIGGINLIIGNGNTTQGNFETTDWKSGSLRIRVEMDPAGGISFAPFGMTDFQSVPFALYSDRAGAIVDGNGNDWTPADDLDEQTLTVNGNQLAISNGNAVTLPTGSGGDNWGTQTIVTEPELTGNGTLVSPLGIATQGASNGDVLKWNGNAWVPQEDNGQNYSAGDGISIVGGVISNTGDDDDDNDNEIQTLSINGNTVSLSNGGGNINLPTYNEGTGIDISGNTISATNTQAIWNANQLQSRNVSSNTPANGQVLKWDGASWAPGTDNGGSYTEGTGINIAGNVISAENTVALWNANKLQGYNISTGVPDGGDVLKFNPDNNTWFPGTDDDSNPWGTVGNNIYYSQGNVGFGLNNPQSRIHVVDEDKIQMDDQSFGKWATVTIEFTSQLAPVTDDLRDLGTSTRRWDDVWATNGMINTSDINDKNNVHSIDYGLDEIMKLRPVSFTWKNRPERGTKLGLIAQELETVIPEVVANAARIPAVNSEPSEPCTRLGVYYSDLIPVLIKAVQEQQLMIENLQTEIAELKKR